MAVEALPYASQELEQTASFVAKVGDYANALARTVGRSGGYSDEELENLRSLAETASVMKLNLQDMQARVTDRVYSPPWTRPPQIQQGTAPSRWPTIDRSAGSASKKAAAAFSALVSSTSSFPSKNRALLSDMLSEKGPS